MKTSNALLGVALLFGATGASALSLGEARGSVVLGRPLDVLFDVRPDAGTPLESSCLVASATAGDVYIDNSRMQITVLPASADRTQAVRVRSRVLVNEPILTVQLTAGCGAQVSRTYHLFADPPSTAAATALPVVPPAPRRAPADVQPDPVKAPQANAAPAPAQRAGSEAKPSEPSEAAPAAPKRARRTAPAAVTARAAPAASAARLVVEPLEDWLLLPPALRMSDALQALPEQAPSAAREQAAAQWQALNASADDSAAQSEHARQLAGQTAAARADAAQAQAALATLQQRLDRLESERYSPSLMYALLALWIATLIGLIWYVLQSRRQAALARTGWYAAVAGSVGRDTWQGKEDASSLPPEGAGSARALQAQDLDILLPEDLPLAPAVAGNDAPSSVRAPLPPSAPEPEWALEAEPGMAPATVLPAAVAATASAVPEMHVVQPEDFFDLQQQADFFISVGEHDQAIAVLTEHINRNHAASPWAYLELLRLYRSLSRVGPFNLLRTQFQQHFNAQVPEFATFHQINRHLLDYPDVLARIEAWWSDDSVVPLLESLLFCRHAAADAPRFDLCAYDDLLMLYAIARTTPASTRGLPPPRQRTTPAAQAAPLPDASPAPSAPAAAPELAAEPLLEMDLGVGAQGFVAPELPVITPLPAAMGNMIEYDFSPPRQNAQATREPLDVDFSVPQENLPDFPPVTLSDLPALPVTPAPAPGQPVGFGANSDLVEARFDLEEREERRPDNR